jgi:hypothetical protein
MQEDFPQRFCLAHHQWSNTRNIYLITANAPPFFYSNSVLLSFVNTLCSCSISRGKTPTILHTMLEPEGMMLFVLLSRLLVSIRKLQVWHDQNTVRTQDCMQPTKLWISIQQFGSIRHVSTNLYNTIINDLTPSSSRTMPISREK